VNSDINPMHASQNRIDDEGDAVRRKALRQITTTKKSSPVIRSINPSMRTACCRAMYALLTGYPIIRSTDYIDM
jgi:hypothetical protein